MSLRRRIVVGAVLCAAGATSACSTPGSPGPTRTVTVTPSPHTTSASASASDPASPSPTAMTALPGTCDSMLPLAAIDNALGRGIAGQTAFVVGLAEADIGRLATVNCRYGLPATADPTAVPVVEIGVSLYDTAEDASKRIPATVDDYVTHGATKSATTVAGHPATILIGGSGAGYAASTIVLAAGQRTVAVGIVENPPNADPTKDLIALATVALTNTGG